MADTFIDGPGMGDLGVCTVTGRFVLVTNGVCTLDHTTPDAYKATHTDGCVYRPGEGLVFGNRWDGELTWRLSDVSGLVLRKATADEIAAVMPRYEARLEQIRELEKKVRRITRSLS